MIVTIMISELNTFFIVVSMVSMYQPKNSPVTIKTAYADHDMFEIYYYFIIKDKSLISSMFYIIWIKVASFTDFHYYHYKNY
jgi:hypothetical protein